MYACTPPLKCTGVLWCAADGTCDAGVIAHGSIIKAKDVEAIQRWGALPHNQQYMKDISLPNIPRTSTLSLCFPAISLFVLHCTGSRPILFLFSDNDQQIPTELREQIQGILKAKSASFAAEGVFYPKQARHLPARVTLDRCRHVPAV